MRGDKRNFKGGSLPLEESRGPFGPGLSSTPSAGDTPATPPDNSLAEVQR